MATNREQRLLLLSWFKQGNLVCDRDSTVMRIFREKAGVISKGTVWVCFHKEYMYLGDNPIDLIKDMVINWNSDRKLVM